MTNCNVENGKIQEGDMMESYYTTQNISIAGRRHKELNELCEDRSCNGSVRNDSGREIHYIAVADGVGSEKYSGIGAEFAISKIQLHAAMIHHNLGDEQYGNTLKKRILGFFHNLRTSSIQYASNLGTTKESMATTLSFAVADDEKTFICSAGDSPICVKLKGQEAFVITGNNAQFIGETVSAFSSTSWDYINIKEFNTKDVERILIISDGAELLIHQKNPDPTYWIKEAASGTKHDAYNYLQDMVYKLIKLQRDDVSIAFMNVERKRDEEVIMRETLASEGRQAKIISPPKKCSDAEIHETYCPPLEDFIE